MRNALATAMCGAALLLGAGCAGTVPKLRGVPEQGMAAVIVGGRFFVPTGEV